MTTSLKIKSSIRAYKMGEHDHWIINVKLNGKRLWAIVDSGANVSCISPQKAKELGLIENTSRSNNAITAEGTDQNIPTYMIENISIGAADYSKRTIYGLDIPGVFEGKYQFIIGLDLLKHIKAVLDISSRRILIKE